MDYKSLSSEEQYNLECKKLLKYIEEREEFAGMLKIVRPEKIPLIRKAIAKCDDIIQGIEKRMELLIELQRLEKEIDEDYANLDIMSKTVEPELLAYLKKNNPEAYEKLKAELEEIDAHYADESDN